MPPCNSGTCCHEGHVSQVGCSPFTIRRVKRTLPGSPQTGKKAGVVLIMEDQGDHKYWLRLNSTIEHHGLKIDTWKTD